MPSFDPLISELITMTDFEAKWKKISDEDDPRRCQCVIPSKGQCSNVQVEHSQYCPAHGGNKAFDAAKKKELRNYRLNKYNKRIQELGNSDVIMSLREEIALLRILIEEKINRCDTELDMILMSGPLSDLVMKVEKVVSSCNRLDSKLGEHLDKTKILQYAQMIVQIIAKYVDDDKVIEAINEDIFTALQDLSKE